MIARKTPAARTGAPIVRDMAMHRLADIAQALMRGGLAAETPVAVMTAAAAVEERILDFTLERVATDVEAQRLEPPAIVAIGDNARVRDRLRRAIASATPS